MKGSIDDIKEAEKPKAVPGRTTYQTLATLLAEHARLDAIEALERGSPMSRFFEVRHQHAQEDEAARARANNERLEREKVRKQELLASQGAEFVRQAMKGMRAQLEQMPKGQRVEALRVIGAALRPFCPEAADYLESVE